MKYRGDPTPPRDWQDFEDLCLGLWRPRLLEPKKHGQSGQRQQGVDVFGRDPTTGGWVGIQCKQKGQWPPKALTIAQLKDEIRKAEAFRPALSHFIVATTAKRDAKLQAFVRRLSERRRKTGREFTVDLYAWEDLQEWLHDGPESISRDKALWVWCDRTQRLHSRLMPYFQDRSAPLLEHVYVELQLDPERIRGTLDHDPEIHSEGRLLARHLSIREVLDLEAADHPWITRRWLLRGDPGSGKTTLLRHLAWTLADAGGKPWVPVFESLPRLMADKLSVFGRIEEDLDRADQPGGAIRELLEEEAREGRLLLLLDGLDEVPREARGRAETLLSELASRWPKSPVVAATRPIGAWSPGPEFLELEVLPFDSERRLAFLERWFGRDAAPDRKQAAAVASVLEGDRGLRELASNPLYLTLLALLVQSGEPLERHRSNLFDQIFDLLEEGRHRKPPTPIEDRETAHEGLCGLAYRMTEDNRDAEAVQALERRLRRDRQVRDALQSTWPRVRDYLDDIAEKTGILGAHDGPETSWRFWHRTFREALAAQRMEQALASGDSTSRIPAWIESLWQSLRGRGMPGLLRHARGLSGDDLGRWAEPYALLVGRVEEPDALVRMLVQSNRALGLRAVATAQGLSAETLAEVLELSEGWHERQKVYERLPELIDDSQRLVALVDRLRQMTRNGNDLFFLEQALAVAAKKWPEARHAVEKLRGRFYDHIPAPPRDLFQWIETPLDGRVELWREIPAGEGWIGAADGEESYDDERPRHRVKISQAFRMAAVPVTNEQYAAFDPTHEWEQWKGVSREALARHPVVNVTWYAAVAFCRWLATRFPGARLPIEEEWEYGCRAGTESRYWSGDSEEDLDGVGWYSKNSDGRTHRVGEKPANGWGLYDVHGNVLEWTATAWSKEPYAGRESGFEVDPAAVEWPDLAESGGGERVIRGGSFEGTAGGARSACRDWGHPGDGGWGRGFRVVLPGP
jgi:formylglycine-generating enzyme required for sulfatase activity